MNDGRHQTLRSFGMRAALAGRTALERGDQWMARLLPKDRPGLLIFIFHCVFADDAEANTGFIDPHERATPENLRQLISYFRDHEYAFVSADDLDHGLDPGGRYVHLTFDDGFANNLHLLDLLAAEGAYATVFPSINHIRTGSAFWWNVVYRERNRRGQLANLKTEYALLRRMTDSEVRHHLVNEFGQQALKPTGDPDRPLTVPELRVMAESPWIEIGNHTLDHAVLSQYPSKEAELQIAGAQDWLRKELGKAPFFIAYPNGNVNDDVVGMARRQGLRVGVTVTPTRNELPISDATRMQLGRLRIVFDHRADSRMRAARTSVQLSGLARGLVVRH